MSVSYDTLVGRYRLSRRELGVECGFNVQLALAEKLSKWRNVGPYLLGEKWETMVEEIEHGKQDEKGKRLALLQRWKEVYGSEATHETLIRALLLADRTDLAEVVCQRVGESWSSE